MNIKNIDTDLKNKSGIYKLSIGGHIYVGSSKDLYSRLKEHRSDLKYQKHNNTFLQNVFNKDGIDNLDFEILEYCEPDIRIEREKFWIDNLNADMNLQDPVTKQFTQEIINKISINTKKAFAEGKGKKKIELSKIECYDYLGNYENTYNTRNEVLSDLGISEKELLRAIRGYKKGVTVRGKRLRYEDSKVPPQKFDINPQYLGRYFDFYTIDDNGNEIFAFDSVRNFYSFLSDQLIKGQSKIILIPKLRKHCEPWNVSKK